MKTNCIELPDCEPIPILYEDRAVIAIDKPRGWMLAPVAWQNTSRNLQAAIESSIAARDFWARSRGLKFLRHVHRLDADTSGVLLFAKSPGAVKRFFELFESRKMEKTYLAVVVGEPGQNEWTCELKLAPDKKRFRKMKVNERFGKNAETHFRVLLCRPRSDVAAGVPSDFGVRRHVGALKSGDMSPQSTSGSRGRSPHQSKAFKTGADKLTLIECKPVTGRTHQIRIHLVESGCPVVGDELYGREDDRLELGLRAVRLAYVRSVHPPAGGNPRARGTVLPRVWI